MPKTWTKQRKRAVEKERGYWVEKLFLGSWRRGVQIYLTGITYKTKDGHPAIIFTFYELGDTTKYEAVYIGRKSVDELRTGDIKVELKKDRTAVNDWDY